ncbi:MAG: hypothetical protein J6Y74_04970 [Clostridia bacterium]|nr:hypothetical protein [Clostridia bacterium]
MKYPVQEGEILLFVTNKHKTEGIVKELGAESIEKDAQGAPFLKGSDLFISLSHKGDVVVLAVSAVPVGVDVEDTSVPRNVERLSKLFHTSERPKDLYAFYRVWTAKEAEGKRQRTGITTEILRKETSSGKYVDWGDYLICVMGEGEVRVIEEA